MPTIFRRKKSCEWSYAIFEYCNYLGKAWQDSWYVGQKIPFGWMWKNHVPVYRNDKEKNWPDRMGQWPTQQSW